MRGRRYDSGPNQSMGNMEPGDYGKGPDGDWWLCAPNGQRGKIDLTKHGVTVWADGTITVYPSAIFLEESHVTPECCPQCAERAHAFGCLHFGFGWHGWLEKGEWIDATTPTEGR